jgi:aminomethyltransferase
MTAASVIKVERLDLAVAANGHAEGLQRTVAALGDDERSPGTAGRAAPSPTRRNRTTYSLAAVGRAMTLRTPPLGEVHADAGAKLTEFGGWEMPVEFDSIRTEHEAVREAAGKFDVSHMGQIEVSGPDAAELTNRLTTNDVTGLDAGDAQYSTITDERGDIVDDTVVYRLPGETDADYLFVPNAGHDADAYDRWVDHAAEWDLEGDVENATEDYAMVALQGPEAVGLLSDHCASPGAISRFTVEGREVAGVDCLVARTGYTGEDGVELLFDADGAEAVWSALDCQPCGLGARDTLRLEAGFLLSGQDFHVEDNPRNPFEAGIGFVVKTATEFVGRDALERVEAEGVDEKLVGFRLLERGVPRHGYDIAVDGETVGTVTSGTMSPTLGEPIGLGYVPVEHAGPGTDLEVLVRGEAKRAEVESLPFYERD